MNKTVKYKVLEFVANNGSTTAKEMQFAIFRAQGKKGKEAITYRSGYYCVGIGQWTSDGLIERVKHGVYKITNSGKRFLKNPQLETAKINGAKWKKSLERVREISYERLKESNVQSNKIHNLEEEVDSLKAYNNRLLARLNFHDEISPIVEAQLELMQDAIADHLQVESEVYTAEHEIALDKVRVELTNIFNSFVKNNI
jgi:hypothetical protein